MNRFSRFFAILVFAALLLGRSASGQEPGDEITVTIAFDNYAAAEGLRTGWGFAAFLETPDHTVLFDTGNEGPSLMENLSALQKDPSIIDAIVISHAHWDHTGGLQTLLATGITPRIFVLSAFADEVRPLVPEGIEILETEPGQEIVPGIRSTGRLGRDIPEQALFFETEDGTVVLTGCAHPGAVAMAQRARDLGSGNLYAVLGGFHLMDSAEGELTRVLGRFRELHIQEAGPTHCSGEQTMDAFRSAYGSSFLELGSGRVLRFTTGI